MNTQCGICGLQIISGHYVGDIIGGLCQGHTYPSAPIISRPIVISTDSTTPPCPLTNSSHEKALVRVEKRIQQIKIEGFDMGTTDIEYIQVLCGCGLILSSNKVREK